MKLVILSSSFINESLFVEFGQILPIELPVHNKELLFHQLNSLKSLEFHKEDTYITVPHGYDYHNDLGVNLLYFNPEVNIFQILNEVSHYFTESDKIFFYYGDTLLTNIDFSKFNLTSNYFFVGEPQINFKWGTQRNGLVPAGGIYLNVSKLKEILSATNSFNEFAEKVYKDSEIEQFRYFSWLDFGSSATFYNSRKNFLEARSFNKIEINNRFLKKSSEDIFKIWVEFKWLKNLKFLYPNNVPFVKDFIINDEKASYFIEYLNHPVLSDIFVFGKLHDDYFLKILFSIRDNLFLFHKNSEIKSTNFLAEKLNDRKDQIFEAIKRFGFNQIFFEELYFKNHVFFVNKSMKFSLFHGDYCFSNILFNFSIFEPVLIDPRGYLSRSSGFSEIGPSNYDIYKLAHSYVAGYDYIISNKCNDNFFDMDKMKSRFVIFCKIFSIEELELKMGLINLFLSMIPLHRDSENRQRSFLELIFKINQL